VFSQSYTGHSPLWLKICILMAILKTDRQQKVRRKNMDLKNKVAIITGASSGIGKATAELFAAQGASLALIGRDIEALQQTKDSLVDKNNALVHQADVTIREQCEQAINKTVQEFGRLDVLVNAAGIIGTGSISDTSEHAWREMMLTNLDSVFNLMQIAVPHLGKTKGNVVNISSVTGLRAFPNILGYCVSKAGVDQLIRCAALELGPQGIRVNGVNPGVVVTNLHRRGGMQEEQYASFLEHGKTTHPLGRVGQPEEIAEAILYLASGKSGWATGVTLSVDGGRHLTCAR
jgi:NAD(P)-dependent dehydrogenase (short-subunit alcohol dehydrogenase family)